MYPAIMDPRDVADTPGAAPSDNTTLTEILGQFEDGGFVGEFEVADDGLSVRCCACQQETPAGEIPQHTLRRLEGASDPADMAVVAGVVCPSCGSKGTLILPYGPNASGADATVLRELRDHRDESAGPRNSAPGETLGDAGTASGMSADTDTGDMSGDAMPGDAAPDFSVPSSTGKELGLDDFLGKVPVALTFSGTLSGAATEELVAAFESAFPEFGKQRVQSLLVVPESPETVRRRRQTGTKVPLLADDDGSLLARFAASATFPATVLIDEDGTITRLLEGGRPADHAAAVVDAARQSPQS